MTSQIQEDCEIVSRPGLTRTVRQCCAAVSGSAALGISLTLGDQAVVSGTNFVTTLLIGRLCGPEELGLYSLGFSLVVLLYSAQRSLVTVPYTVFWNRVEPGRQQEYAGSALVNWGMMSVVAMAGLAAWSAAIAAGFGPPQSFAVIWVLVGITPFLLMREFARNYAYAHLRIREAIILDVAVSVCQIGGLAVLIVTGTLNAMTAFAVVGGAALLGALPWLWLRKTEFAPRLGIAWKQLRSNWSFARWIFASRMVTYLGSDILILWMLAVLLGKSATGVFAACLSVVMFSSPFVQGIGQYLTPQISHAYAEEGVRRLRQVVLRADLLIGGVMGIFTVTVGLLGETMMGLFYGELYVGHHSTIVVLSLAVMADALTIATSKGLWVLNRPDLDLVGRCVGLTVTVVAATALFAPLGVLGVATGWLVGCASAAVTLRLLFEWQTGVLLGQSSSLEMAAPGHVALSPVTCELGVTE